MSKQRKSVTIEPHLADEIDRRNELNFSALVNELIENYFYEGDSPHKMKTALQVRLDRIESKLDEKEKRIQQLQKEREEIEELIQEKEGQEDPQIEEAVEVLQTISEEQLTKDNPAVQNQAAQVGIPPSKLIEKVKEDVPGKIKE